MKIYDDISTSVSLIFVLFLFNQILSIKESQAFSTSDFWPSRKSSSLFK